MNSGSESEQRFFWVEVEVSGIHTELTLLCIASPQPWSLCRIEFFTVGHAGFEEQFYGTGGELCSFS